MHFLPYPLSTLYPFLGKPDTSRIRYWDDFMENPWVGPNPQPDCHKCGRGHIPTTNEVLQLQSGDVRIDCECGSSFTLTEAFRNAIYRDRTDEAAAHLIADWVEVASITPNVGSFEPIPFRSHFSRVLRVDLSCSYSATWPPQPSGLLGTFIAVPYWIAVDGFTLLTVPVAQPLPEGCMVTYKAYGSLEGNQTPDWVRTVHTSRRLEMEKDFDSAIALLGVATEAFARAEFLMGSPNATISQSDSWRQHKDSQGGLYRVLEKWSSGTPASSVLPNWKQNVWDMRNLTFHEERTLPDEETFRSALDTTLALIFGLRPAAMLELAGATPLSGLPL